MNKTVDDLRTPKASEYWMAAIGGPTYLPQVWGKHIASHPVSVRQAMRTAGQRAPECADVIAALVWRLNLAENRLLHMGELLEAQVALDGGV